MNADDGLPEALHESLPREGTALVRYYPRTEICIFRGPLPWPAGSPSVTPAGPARPGEPRESRGG